MNENSGKKHFCDNFSHLKYPLKKLKKFSYPIDIFNTENLLLEYENQLKHIEEIDMEKEGLNFSYVGYYKDYPEPSEDEFFILLENNLWDSETDIAIRLFLQQLKQINFFLQNEDKIRLMQTSQKCMVLERYDLMNAVISKISVELWYWGQRANWGYSAKFTLENGEWIFQERIGR